MKFDQINGHTAGFGVRQQTSNANVAEPFAAASLSWRRGLEDVLLDSWMR